MKKLFLLIPALVLSLMVKAADQYPDPAVDNSLATAVNAVGTGETIYLDEGIYTNSDASDYTKIRGGKNITFKAIEGKNPVVQLKYAFQIREASSAKFMGIKFDGTNLAYDSYFLAYDATDNTWEFEDCEFTALSKYVIQYGSDKKVASVVFNKCYFHDITKSCIYIDNTGEANLTVRNSTFANIDASAVSAGMIESKTATGAVLVDHCTFYNCKVKNTDYGTIKVASPNATVSNCIFAMPTSTDDLRTVYVPSGLEAGTTVTHCIMHNYTKDSNIGIPSRTGLTKEECNAVDPLFNDLANNKYTFYNNWVTMSISPAVGAATDGSDLGDPRWYTDPVLPSTDFASNYDLLGTKAKLAGNIRLNANGHIEYYDNSVAGTATWKIHAAKACAVQATIDMETGSSSGSIFQIVALDNSGEEVGNIETTYKNDDADIVMPGAIYFPAEGDYTIRLNNNQPHSSAKVEKITLSYIGGAVQSLPGTTDINEAWFVGGTRADGKITFTSGYVSEGWAKWNVAFASAANYNVKLNVYSNNNKKITIALQDADGNDVVTPLYKEGGDKHETDPVVLEMGAMSVPAGNYTLKVTNAEDWSDAKIISVQFVRAGGGLVDIPGNLSFDEVILSPRAFVNGEGEIQFTDETDAQGSQVTAQYAKWNMHVSKEGYYKFAAHVKSDNGQSYTMNIYNSDETVLKGSAPLPEDGNHGLERTFSTDAIYLAEGDYILKIQNNTNYSHGRVLDINATYEGGAVVEIPANPIPLTDAIITVGATRNGSGLGFNGSVSEYAQWNIEAAAGVYNFTLTVTGSNYSIYKLDVLDGGDNIFTYSQGQSGAGTVTINNVFIPAAGNYVLQLANVNSSADGVITSISAALDDVLILDENATDAAYISAVNGEKKKIILNRTFKGGMYNTICLPFSDWVSSLELVFGTGYELLELNNAELDGDVLNLNFTAVTGEFGHGRPYLIKPTHDVTNPTWTTSDGRTIYASTSYNIKSSTAADFIGSFIAGEVPAGEDNLFLGPNNLLYFSQTTTPIKGTRAYFRVKVPNPAQAISRARIVTGGKVATEINLVNESAKVGGAAKIIENGQLIIIRDGVQYNVMGVKIN